MKHAIVILLAFIVTTATAQKKIKLQVAYIPDHQYTIENKNIMKMVMDSQVDDATKEQLKSSGMSFPIEMNMNQDVTMLITTGPLNEKKEVPITVEYTKYDLKQTMGENELPSQVNMLKGLKMSGWADEKGKLRYENIEGEAATEELKKLMTGMADQIGTQISFPEKPLKVGDEFTQEVPFNMPLQGGVELKMIVKTVYKLISFNADKAMFDTVIVMTMDMSMDKGTMTAEGSGNGKMAFDIKKNFVSTYNSTMDMIMKMKMGPMDMDIKSSTESQMTVLDL